MTQACCFSLQIFISLLSWRESPCLMLIQHPSLAPSDSHSFLTPWQMENAAWFLRNIRGKCNALVWPMLFSLFQPTPFSRHPRKLPWAQSFRWPTFKICSNSQLSALPIARPRPNHFVKFCQKSIHPSTDERCAVIMEVSGYPEVRSDGFSRGITAIPFPLGPCYLPCFLF